MSSGQMLLFVLPEIAHGQEWITGYDSAGQWRFFSRPVGESGLFFNEFAGPVPNLPGRTSGDGEAVDEFGNVYKDFVPSASYRKFLHGRRFHKGEIQ